MLYAIMDSVGDLMAFYEAATEREAWGKFTWEVQSFDDKAKIDPDDFKMLEAQTLRGHEAIELAQADYKGRVRLNKYADPVSDEEVNISICRAKEIAKQDPSLIYVTVD